MPPRQPAGRSAALTWPRVHPGDLVRIGEYEGMVREADLAGVLIECVDGALVSLPAQWVEARPVVLLSPMGAKRPVTVRVRVARHADLARAEAALMAAARSADGVSGDWKTTTRLIGADDTGLELLLTVEAPGTEHPLRLRDRLLARVVEALQSADIETPRTSQDVFLRDLDFVRATVQRVMGDRSRQAATTPPAPAEDG